MYPRQPSTGVVFRPTSRQTVGAAFSQRVLEYTNTHVHVHKALQTEARGRAVHCTLHLSPHDSTPISRQHRGLPGDAAP